MKSLTDKNVFTIIAALGFVAILLVYMLVFKDYREKTEELKSRNNTLRVQVADMKVYYDNREEYRKSKAELQAEVERIVEEYPADAREEDIVMMAVHMQESSDVKYENINLEQKEEVYVIPAEEVCTAGVESLQEQIVFYKRQVTYNGSMDYDSLKNCVRTIYSDRNRIGIHNVSFQREEHKVEDEYTTELKGNIDVSFYSMTGTGKEYTVPDMKDYIMGNGNPFNLLKPVEDLRD